MLIKKPPSKRGWLIFVFYLPLTTISPFSAVILISVIGCRRIVINPHFVFYLAADFVLTSLASYALDGVLSYQGSAPSPMLKYVCIQRLYHVAKEDFGNLFVFLFSRRGQRRLFHRLCPSSGRRKSEGRTFSLTGCWYPWRPRDVLFRSLPALEVIMVLYSQRLRLCLSVAGLAPSRICGGLKHIQLSLFYRQEYNAVRLAAYLFGKLPRHSPT